MSDQPHPGDAVDINEIKLTEEIDQNIVVYDEYACKDTDNYGYFEHEFNIKLYSKDASEVLETSET